MGDEIKFASGLKLHIAAPTSGMIRLFRNGVVVQEGKGDTMGFAGGAGNISRRSLVRIGWRVASVGLCESDSDCAVSKWALEGSD